MKNIIVDDIEKKLFDDELFDDDMSDEELDEILEDLDIPD